VHIKFQLNGWVRLWIVLAIFGLLVSGVLAYDSRPHIESISHEAAFDEELSDEAKTQRAEEQASNITEVRMPNGHILRLRSAIEASRSTALLAEYAEILERELTSQRIGHYLIYSIWWLSLSVIILVFGTAVAWVRRGFTAE
jgi:hypothetical protein